MRAARVGPYDAKGGLSEVRFKITFKFGPEVIAVVEGLERPAEALNVGDVTERIIETEQYLERLTGLRVHIETGD